MFVFRTLGNPWLEIGILGTHEPGDQACVCAVALIASELAAGESLDTAGINDVNLSKPNRHERLGNGFGVVSGLLETGDDLSCFGGLPEPRGEASDASRSIVEALGVRVICMKNVAEEIAKCTA